HDHADHGAPGPETMLLQGILLLQNAVALRIFSYYSRSKLRCRAKSVSFPPFQTFFCTGRASPHTAAETPRRIGWRCYSPPPVLPRAPPVPSSAAALPRAPD